MFQAIQYVGTPIALVAFVIAVIAYAYRARLVERRKTIESAAEADRGRLLEATLRDFTTVNTETLTREQRYQLAMRLIEERAAKVRVMAIVAIVSAIILAAVILALPSPVDAAHSLTVRVQDPAGGFITSGEVTLDAGAARDTRAIGADGQVRFENIPRASYEQGVTLHPNVAGFAAAAVTLREPPAGGVHYLELAPVATALRGTVVDARRVPLAGVVVSFQSGLAVDTTDGLGGFQVTLPHPPGARVPVRAVKDGQLGFNDQVVIPDGGDLTLIFDERS